MKKPNWGGGLLNCGLILLWPSQLMMIIGHFPLVVCLSLRAFPSLSGIVYLSSPLPLSLPFLMLGVKPRISHVLSKPYL